MTPKLSIVIPCYKRLDVFFKSLALNEIFRDQSTEIVLVVDAPCTSVKELGAAFSFPYTGIRLRILENGEDHEWRPPCIPINVGVRHALGKYVAIMSPETIIQVPCRDYLDFKMQEDRGHAYCGFGWNVEGWGLDDEPDLLLQRMNHARAANPPSYFCGGFLMVRKHEFAAVCGMDESRQHWGNDDADIRYRLVRSGVHFHIDPNIQIFHLWHNPGVERKAKRWVSSQVVLDQQRETWGTADFRVIYDWAKQNEQHDLSKIAPPLVAGTAGSNVVSQPGD